VSSLVPESPAPPPLPWSERWLYPRRAPWPQRLCAAGLGRLYLWLNAQRRTYYLKNTPPPPPCPVLSVGSIVMGGSGKTPVAEWCARFLAAHCQPRGVAYLLRGYGRPQRAPWIGRPHGQKAPPTLATLGDEAAMLYGSLADFPNLWLGVGARRRSILHHIAQRDPDLAVAILDDGMQHLRLPRDLDIAVVPPDLEALLPFPAGPLRESPAALATAHLLWLHLGDGSTLSEHPQWQSSDRAAVVTRLVLRALLPSYDTLPPAPRAAVLLTAIGRNANAVRLLQRHGITVVSHLALRDHAPFSGATLRRAFAPGHPIIVTCKDWPRVQDAVQRHRLSLPPGGVYLMDTALHFERGRSVAEAALLALLTQAQAPCS